MTPLQTGGVAVELGATASVAVETLSNVLGLALLSALAGALTALVYRWYVRERCPSGLPLLVGLSVVAVALGTTTLLAAEIETARLDPSVVPALLNIATFLVCALAARLGAWAGDRVGTDLFVADARSSLDADVSEIVQTVGRVTTVELPETVDDIVGYDPVPDETRETLAGRRFLVPRRLSREEVRERLVARLRTDYDVGHVDMELDADGAVSYLAVGQRAAGIGPTLPPATNAVAIRADPANAASAGDLVQVWETDPPRRVLTGELRGVGGDVVTIAVDAADTRALDPTAEYRLVTLPVRERPDREFASLLRAADETLATITVAAGSDLDGALVGSLPVTVAAVARENAAPDPLPDRDRPLAAGDVLYAIATPEALRKAEALAAAGDGAASATGREAGDGALDAPAAAETDPAAVAEPGRPSDRADADASGTGDGASPAGDAATAGGDGTTADDTAEDGDAAGGGDPTEDGDSAEDENQADEDADSDEGDDAAEDDDAGDASAAAEDRRDDGSGPDR